MLLFGSAALAFLLASGIAASELITTKYPRTYFIFIPRRCLALYVYSFIYGLLAFVIVFFNIVPLQADVWIQAVIVGVSVKAFLHIRFWSVPTPAPTGKAGESEGFPIGPETILQLFEPWLLRTITLDEFNGVREFLGPRAVKYTDPQDVERRIRDNLSESLPVAELASFRRDLDAIFQSNPTRSQSNPTGNAQIIRAMELYLKLFGKQSFNRAFPA